MDVSQNPQSNRVANETPWQQWRRQGCCTERQNQKMQIFYVEYDDQAEARATSSSRLDNSHWISFFYPASRHRCSIAEKSMDVSQNPQSNRVANETPWQQWRRQGCCTERQNQRMQIFYVEYDDQAEARATSSSRLDNSHWISFFYPASRHRCSIAEKSMDVSQNPQSNRVANETPWQQWRRQGCCTERQNQRMQIFYVCGVWWPSWSTCNKQQPTWQFPLNKLFFTLQEEQSLCFLTAWQSIHLGQPRITFPSPFRVAGVGRSIITRF